jgi:hypothetical protein
MEGDLVNSASMMSSGSESTATVTASPYTISIGDALGSGLSNYTINYVEGSMEVTPLSLAGTIVGSYGQICPGESKLLTNNNGIGAIQWQMSSNDIDFTPIEDANASEYDAVVSTDTYFRVIRTSGNCDPVISPSFLVSVANTTEKGTISGGNITVCSATNSITLTNEGSVGSVQWMYAVSKTGTYRTLWGQTGKTLVLNNFSGNNVTYYFAKVSLDCSAVVYTDQVTVTVLKSVAGTISGAGSVCLGNTKTLTLSGSIGKIQWQSSADNILFTDIAGATNTTYITDAITEARYYRAVITNADCEPATSQSVAVTISESVVAGTISEGDMVVCRGSSASLNLTGNSSESIIWYKSVNYSNATSATPLWTVVSGQTGTTLNSGSLTVNTWYKAKVISGACSNETDVVTVTVNPLSTVKTISGAGAICNGSSKILTLASGSVGTLQWQSSATSATAIDFANIDGATSSTYTASPAVTTWYRVVSTSGVCSSATSLAVAVTVSQPALVGDISTTKTAICTTGGTTLTLSSAQGSIVWQKATVTNEVLGTFTTLIENTSSVTTGNTLATTAYRVVVSSGVCPVATSNVVTVTVSPTSVVKTISGAGAICNGSSKVLTLATGSVGTLQWQSSTTSATATDFANIDGATSLTYTASPTVTTWYRVVSTSGVCSSATSTAVAVTVSQPTAVGTLSALATTLCTGTGTTLSLTSTTGTIAWQKATVTNGVTGTFAAVTGNVSSTLATGNLTTTTAYRVVVSSGLCTAATSNVVVVSVNPLSTVKTISGAGAICNGSSRILTLATGSVGTLQWQSSTTSATATNFTNIDGATSLTFTASPSVTTWYRVVSKSGVCSSVNSVAVAVTVSQPTSVGTLTAATTTLCSASGTTLTLAAAQGTIAWQKAPVSSNGVIGTYVAVSGNTTRTLATGNLTATTAYRVVVSSGACSTSTSNVIIVAVSPAAVAKAVTGHTGTTTLATAICTTITKTLTLGSGYVGAIQWQYYYAGTSATAITNTSTTATWTDIPNATLATYSAASTTAGNVWFRVKLTSGPCALAYSVPVNVWFKANCAAKLDANPDSTEELVSEEFKAIAYPNPSTSVFQIEVSTPSSVKKKLFNVQVYDMTGRFIEQRQVQQSENIEIGNNYPSGMYSIIVTKGEQVKTLRVIKK